MSILFYGTDYSGGPDTAILSYVRSDGTWTTTAKQQLGPTSPEGMAYDSNNGVMYTNNLAGQTYTINLTSGAWTALPNPSGPSGTADLTYDGNTDTLYGVVRSSLLATNGIYEINRSTGIWTKIGSSGITDVTYSIAYDPMNNIMYGIGANVGARLYTINRTTGNWENPILMNVSVSTNYLEFHPEGNTLYMNTFGSPGNLFTINVTSGIATLVGGNVVLSARGFAYIPVKGSTFLGLYRDISTQHPSLYSIAEDGAWTLFRPEDSGVTNPSGVAFNCNNQSLYGCDLGGTTYAIDYTSGEWLSIGASGFTTLRDIEYDPFSSILFGIRADGLYEVGADGSWTLLSTNPTDRSPTALAYDCNQNILYCLTEGLGGSYYLFHIHRPTGTFFNELHLTFGVGEAPIPRAIGYNQNNQSLYYFDNNDNAYFIDTITGELTLTPSNTGVGEQARSTTFVGPICCICVAEDTKVKLANGKMVEIKDIRSGDIVINHRGKETKVLSNVNSGKQKSFICIEQNAFNKNQPSERILIKYGHPLLIFGKEISCETLVEMGFNGVSEIVLDEAKDIYTLVTDRKDFVIMNDVPIATWGEEEFQSFRESNSTGNFKLK